MEYNTEKQQLIIPEYGRVVQNLVGYLLTIEDKEARTRNAKAVMSQMVQLTPKEQREAADFKQRIWDHLHIISDYKLDIEGSFPKPEPEQLSKKPDVVPYPSKQVNLRYYGNIVEKMIQKVIAIEDYEQQQEAIRAVASYMKRMYLMWNQDSVTDDIILDHLVEISGGKLRLSENQNLYKNENINRPKNMQYKQQGGGGGFNRNNNNNRRFFKKNNKNNGGRKY